MKRRSFFQMGFSRVLESAIRTADNTAQERASHWFRPPFAVRELDFLLGCTRCDRCIQACPPQILFPLPIRLGPNVVGTPAMDLLNKGCLLCADWPCVAACEPQVLLREADQMDRPVLPKLSKVVIDTTLCLPFSGPECGACGSVCPIPGALVMQGGLRPHIIAEHCTGCALCRAACPTTPKAIHVITLSIPPEKTCAESV
ncbi:MAG: hypothetical protein HQL75_17915 [Magnetococcales bacterium]|nr:hypothetical protein [Magnetococcales bacterium]